MHRNRILAAVVAAAVMVPAVAEALPPLKRIASSSASGDYAIATASANTKRPSAIYVAVTTTPRQAVDVSWSLVCSRGFNAGSKSGQYTTSSTKRRKLRLPMSRVDSCTVSALGQMSAGGKVVVRIFKR